MRLFDAAYFDGHSAVRHPVHVLAGRGRLHVVGAAVDFEVPLDEVKVEPPVSGNTHLLRLPDGAQLRTDDVQAVIALFPAAGAGSWLHRLEARWRFALGAVALIAAVAAWSTFYGLPLAAKVAAERLPERFSQELGKQTLAVIDGTFCAPSRIPEARQAELRSGALARLLAGMDDAGKYRLEFRWCKPLGANAVALPDGTLVVTDQLLRIAQDDEEVAAVLAHEVGHVRNRHGLRLTLQAAGVAILVTTLATDAVSITSLAAALPTVLLQRGYSRQFEDEADEFALARLKQVGISPGKFAAILESLERDHDKGPQAAARGRSGPDYLSTHPTTERRIARARAAATP